MKTSDKILTFAAIFISCLALIVSIFQTRILQKQSDAAVWPRLTCGAGYGPDYYKYMVRNQGVGPAVVSSIQYNYKDTTFNLVHELMNYFAELESAEIDGPVRLNYGYGNIYIGDVIGVGDEREVYTAKDSTSVGLGYKYFNETQILIDYCSINENCWRLKDLETSELE